MITLDNEMVTDVLVEGDVEEIERFRKVNFAPILESTVHMYRLSSWNMLYLHMLSAELSSHTALLCFLIKGGI